MSCFIQNYFIHLISAAMLGVATIGIAGTVASITGGKILDTVGVSDMLLLGTIVTVIGFVIICISTENAEVKMANRKSNGY